MAQAAFDAGADKPEVSISVTYVNLGDTDEYAAYKDVIKKAHMGDDVTLEHPELDIDVKLRVVKKVWDAAHNRMSAITLGTQMPNYANTAVSKDIDLSALKDSAPTNLKENERYNGMYANHTDGFVTVATISGKTITTRQNSYDGFAVYEGSTFIGGIKVVDGKVLFKGNATETTATISGHTITIKQDPAEGLVIYEGSTFIGGLKIINNQVVLISSLLQNILSSKCYAKIGKVTIDEVDYEGIFVYHTDISTSNPAFSIVTNGNSSDQVVTIADKDGSPLIQMDTSGGMYLFSNGSANISSNSRETILWFGVNDAIGVDSAGPFYIKDGSIHYF